MSREPRDEVPVNAGADGDAQATMNGTVTTERLGSREPVTGRGLQVHLIRPLMPDQTGSQLDSSLVIEAAGHLPSRFDVVAPLGVVAVTGPLLERVA